MQIKSSVFISGYNKSGTTLFLALLDNHPELVVIPEELHFFKTVLFARNKMAAIRNATGFRMFMDDSYLAEWSRGKSWFEGGYPEYDKKRFCECLDELAIDRLTVRDLLISLVGCFAGADNIDLARRRYWVSKTTQDEINFPIIRDMFKSFHYYYIIRDPRDVWASYIKRKDTACEVTESRVAELVTFASEWAVQVNQARNLSINHANFHIVRYEDVVCMTSEVLGKVADTLGITFNQVLLRPTRHGNPWGGNSVFADGFQTLSREPIDRYKRVLPPAEQVCLASMLQRELANFQYPVESESFGGLDVSGAIRGYRNKLFSSWMYYHLKQKVKYLRYRMFC